MDTTFYTALLIIWAVFGVGALIFSFRRLRSLPKKSFAYYYRICLIAGGFLGFLLLLWIMFYILPMLREAGI